MSDNHYTLRLDRITKRYDEFTAVNELSLNVRPGRIFGLLGPNGAGKTTTIRMVVNITAPDEGRIEIFGQPLSMELQDRIGFLPEERGLYKKMKVGEQLKFFGALKGLDGKTAEKKIDRWLERVELSAWKKHKSEELSKGMQQKIQFIASVLHDPDLVILDEPFSGLDPVNARLLEEIVLELKEEGKTIIFSTHQMESAEQMCDDICLLNKSRKVLDGPLREVKASFGRDIVALRLTGGAEIAEDERLVRGVQVTPDEVKVQLHRGADAQELLQRLMASGARINKFELVEPTLKDIFISKVKEDTT
jgi:ABC-2 type transport system ATP-binding protein